MSNFNFLNEMQEARKNTLSYTCKLSEIAPVSKAEIKIKGKVIPFCQSGKDRGGSVHHQDHVTFGVGLSRT